MIIFRRFQVQYVLRRSACGIPESFLVRRYIVSECFCPSRNFYTFHQTFRVFRISCATEIQTSFVLELIGCREKKFERLKVFQPKLQNDLSNAKRFDLLFHGQVSSPGCQRLRLPSLYVGVRGKIWINLWARAWMILLRCRVSLTRCFKSRSWRYNRSSFRLLAYRHYSCVVCFYREALLLQIRKAGTETLVEICRVNPSYVKRVADLLIQMYGLADATESKGLQQCLVKLLKIEPRRKQETMAHVETLVHDISVM